MPAAFAQTEPAVQPLSAEECKAQEAVLERDMALARSRGQMLRRRELADTLSALQLRCQALAPMSREARIEKLEREIRTLRAELERAEAQLRSVKSESP
ncbi:multidrug resistance efflux pump [Variovorax boronicumulans]|uniref:Multidrug resistance efflux pump n=1 Tax=Variovorax boronicumulans TaxID=436515 RepID=A0AAW8DPC1_9BURK|nr:DUF1090 family protein [Variovorax boronicumulans]MDP9875993.1 multidrug resistance efflux pump [Variovorax boronicumulans]MDP9917086.1 multidrug resistance efflux pump [Variovorax boronicumulans]MDP9921277.1 multidrug resistance efflux pump [Variovorax boronicumulans]